MKKYIIPTSSVIHLSSEGVIAASEDSGLKMDSSKNITDENSFGTQKKSSDCIWSNMSE